MKGFIFSFILAGLVGISLANDTTGACTGIDCKNGNCRNIDNLNYACDCFNGWFGKPCDRRTSPCASFGCTAEQCEAVGNTCKCKPGWGGADCKTKQEVTLTISPSQASYTAGTGVTFTCATTASAVSYAWILKKNNSPVANSGGTANSATFARTLTDVGTSIYTCTVATPGSPQVLTSNTVAVTVVGTPIDSPCPPNKCNSGKCEIKFGNKGICDCKGTGFTGEFCQIRATGACETNVACANGGECRDTGTWKCVCKSGFSGPFCQTVDNPCLIGCNNGVCGTRGGKPVCLCNSGWKGDYCTLPDSDICNGFNCNNGACRVAAGQAVCDCSAGWAGVRCDVRVKTTLQIIPSAASYVKFTNVQFKCTTNAPGGSYTWVLKRNGVPDGTSANTATNTHSFARQLSTTGTFTYTCESTSVGNPNIGSNSVAVTVTAGGDPCVGVDCNNGVCTVTGGVTSCDCDDGWWGATCTLRDLCFINPTICQHGAKCIRQASNPGFSCQCEKGFSGIYCQKMLKGAPCTTDRDCDVGYMDCPVDYRGFCKIPEMQCMCVVDPKTKCECHADCHTLCKTGFGLCMKDGECNCFDTKEQMLFDAKACGFPFSPPHGHFIKKNVELGLVPSS